MAVNRPWVPQRPKHHRSHDNSKFYNSRAWRNFRKGFLESNPLCVDCDKRGEVVPANIADHITPITRGGDKLNEENIQALCKKCHEKKSARESAQIRGTGQKVRSVKACTSLDSQNFTQQNKLKGGLIE